MAKQKSENEDGPTGAVGHEGIPGLSPEETITIPQEVVDALGGIPIPAPPVRMPRPTVARVGESLAKTRPDPGGLLANPRPERREAVRRIDQARKAIADLVRTVESALATAAAKVGEASTDADACEAEGFDVIRANALIEDLEAAFAKHLG